MTIRVLVVDDLLGVEVAVARALEDESDVEVTGVRNPRELAALLAADNDFQLALVDLHYGRGAPASGIAAVDQLSAYSIPCIVQTADAEENRVLFLLAVFKFFPETWTLVSKSAGHDPIRSAVAALRAGYRPDDTAARRYKKAIPMLDALVCRPSDLLIWRALLNNFREPQVAQAAHVSKRVVSQFTADRRPVVERIESDLLGRRPPADDDIDRRGANLLEVSRFARLNADFFNDPDVERLFSQPRAVW
ncbi:hypothetical protein [Pseudofrankia sp. DC12]|uniref:hypothetical protein n=1 Tax=Pseudofrankia sp. DC12 TaxID=683315 RepID=UPI000B19DC31|nr:hypothetical protein [Pseudofrankia sp. DC12]